jgi:hypothetical protein
MPANYYRIDLRIPPELSIELEKFQREVYEQTGKKKSKAFLIREMMKEFLEKASSSCIPKTKKS